MKTRILKWSFALAVVVAAGYITYSSQTEIQLSGVSIDNVEALASGEGGTECTGPKVKGECQSSNEYPCSDNTGCD